MLEHGRTRTPQRFYCCFCILLAVACVPSTIKMCILVIRMRSVALILIMAYPMVRSFLFLSYAPVFVFAIFVFFSLCSYL